MISYKQYLQESSSQPKKHIATMQLVLDDVNIYPGDTFYRLDGHLHRNDGPAVQGPVLMGAIIKNGYEVWMKHGLRHRLDGPAVIWPPGERWWYVEGKPISSSYDDQDSERWLLLKTNIESNFPALNGLMNKEMQKYVCENRPDLIKRIKNLDPELKEKYKHELELSNIEI